VHRTFVFAFTLKVFYAMMYCIRACVEILAVFALALKPTYTGFQALKFIKADVFPIAINY